MAQNFNPLQSYLSGVQSGEQMQAKQLANRLSQSEQPQLEPEFGRLMQLDPKRAQLLIDKVGMGNAMAVNKQIQDSKNILYHLDTGNPDAALNYINQAAGGYQGAQAEGLANIAQNIAQGNTDQARFITNRYLQLFDPNFKPTTEKKAKYEIKETPTGFIAINPENPEQTKFIDVDSKAAESAKKRAEEDLKRRLAEEKTVFDRANTLRNRYDKLSAGFREVEQAYENMQVAENNGQGDLARVFAYMKMLDPGVAVMEGDVVNVRNASGQMQKALGLWNSLKGEGTLTDKVRRELEAQTKKLYEPAKKRNEALKMETVKLGKQFGVGEEYIFTNQPSQQQAPSNGQPSDSNVINWDDL